MPFIHLVLFRRMDLPTRSEFDSFLRNSKKAVIIVNVDQFLENRDIIMIPGWNGTCDQNTTKRGQNLTENPTKKLLFLQNLIGELKKTVSLLYIYGKPQSSQVPEIAGQRQEDGITLSQTLCAL